MFAVKGAILFCEMTHGDPKLAVKSTFMNSFAILRQIWRIYYECFENNMSYGATVGESAANSNLIELKK